MANFANGSEWSAEQAPKGLPVLWVPRYPRRDGKYLVSYAFESRTIKAILTAEKLEAEKISGKWEVRQSGRLH